MKENKEGNEEYQNMFFSLLLYIFYLIIYLIIIKFIIIGAGIRRTENVSFVPGLVLPTGKRFSHSLVYLGQVSEIFSFLGLFEVGLREVLTPQVKWTFLLLQKKKRNSYKFLVLKI